MGIKQTDRTDIHAFIEPESKGFIYDTARSFLKRHSQPELLLSQLKSLLAQGALSSCSDLIQLIIREGHSLSDDSRIYLLRAQIAFEMGESLAEVQSWVKQASLCTNRHTDFDEWTSLMNGIQALKEGDYQQGETILDALLDVDSVAIIARYKLAHHLFWKNLNTQKALILLEGICSDRPEFLQAWSCLGFLYNKLGRKTDAQQAFSHCLKHETNPDKIQFYKQQLAS